LSSSIAEAPQTLLIVDDDRSLLNAVASAFDGHGFKTQCCATVREAIASVDRARPDVLLLDLSLPDGDAFDVLDALSRKGPMPAVVAISGVASPVQAFCLAQRGSIEFVEKPFTTKKLRAAVERALNRPRNLIPHLRSLVGHQGVFAAEQQLRSTMLDEALARSGGSRRRAAALLDVSRQLLQFMMKKRSAEPGRNPAARRSSQKNGGSKRKARRA
jgi:two-component system response regulator RegA